VPHGAERRGKRGQRAAALLLGGRTKKGGRSGAPTSLNPRRKGRKEGGKRGRRRFPFRWGEEGRRGEGGKSFILSREGKGRRIRGGKKKKRKG